jgi:hypothetical protein
LNELQDIAGWNRYWNDFVVIQTEKQGNIFEITTLSGENANAVEFAALAKQQGCAALRGWEEVGAFCLQTDQQASIAPFCPVTCGCRRNPSLPGCPTTCVEYAESYDDALRDVPCVNVPSGALTVNGPFLSWAYHASKRYEHWYYNAVVSNQRLPSSLTGITFENFWLNISAYGCENFDTSLCSEEFGAYSILTLCGKLCGCDRNTSNSCPRQCSKQEGSFSV